MMAKETQAQAQQRWLLEAAREYAMAKTFSLVKDGEYWTMYGAQDIPPVVDFLGKKLMSEAVRYVSVLARDTPDPKPYSPEAEQPSSLPEDDIPQ